MSRHRLDKRRPRYGRISALVVSIAVTVAAALGGAGLIPATVMGAPAGADGRAHIEVPGAAEKQIAEPIVLAAPVTVAPVDSGQGRRVVFSGGEQRVWLIGGNNTVQRTYLVSGSLTDNLAKGDYKVFSKSSKAEGIDDSGSMQWFVRFARGDRAAIGFHDIPVQSGTPLQTEAQLGTPLSHGCIRQAAEDARALWKFAPVGTPVIVI